MLPAAVIAPRSWARLTASVSDTPAATLTSRRSKPTKPNETVLIWSAIEPWPMAMEPLALAIAPWPRAVALIALAIAAWPMAVALFWPAAPAPAWAPSPSAVAPVFWKSE